MRIWALTVSTAVIFFAGCSTKINPAQFTPVQSKMSYKPSYHEITQKTNILIVPFKGRYAKTAKDYLSYILNNYSAVKVLNRQYKSLKDEIKLSELAKNSSSNLNQADYLIFGKINYINTKTVYYPPTYYRDKKGRLHEIPGYYSHTACSGGNIKTTALPENILAKEYYFSDCTRISDNKRYIDFNPLIVSSIQNGIASLKDKIYKFFAKKGFVYEIRENDGNIILHTTLGSNFGARKDEKVDIFRYKTVKIPFSQNKKRITTKIGEGIIKIVTPDSSWVLVKKGKNFEKGDFIKMNFKDSFWDIF